MLKYPAQESAIAYVPENSTPFDVAVIGTTLHIDNYSVAGTEPTSRLRIDYIIDGEGEYFLDGQWITAKAGDTFLLAPHAIYIARGSVHKLWISFEAGYSAAFLNSYRLASGVYTVPQIRNYFDALQQLTHESAASAYVHFDIAENVQKIIHRLALAAQNQQTDSAMSIRSMLNSMVYQKASLTEIADATHMSKANVIRIFKKSFGITPHQYLLEQKIEAAKILLKETNISVKAISERLCIIDEHYFSQLFKKHTGVSPGQYRKG